MAIRAVLFDIGGVLEIVGDPDWVRGWTGGSLDEIEARMELSQDAATLGHVDEAGIRAAYRDALGLSEAQADRFMAQMWDWYCGTLDERLVAWAGGLSGVRVAILSNSADGARREEESRYSLSRVFDPVLYSHEIHLAKPDPAAFAYASERLGCLPSEVLFLDDLPENVEAARALGMSAILHRSTPDTISRAERLLRVG